MNLLQSKYMPYIGLPRGQRTRAINHITPRFSITLTWQTQRYDILACTFKFVHFQGQSIQWWEIFIDEQKFIKHFLSSKCSALQGGKACGDGFEKQSIFWMNVNVCMAPARETSQIRLKVHVLPLFKKSCRLFREIYYFSTKPKKRVPLTRSLDKEPVIPMHWTCNWFLRQYSNWEVWRSVRHRNGLREPGHMIMSPKTQQFLRRTCWMNYCS